MARPDPYVRKPGVEPFNCTKVATCNVQREDKAEEEACRHVNKNPKKNCCTISGDSVTKWELPPAENKVELMKADSGITCLYHRKLDVE